MKPNIKIWPIGDLKPYDQNAKKHDKAQIAKIAKSISDFGWSSPIIVDKDGVIIAGHGRRLAAISIKESGGKVRNWENTGAVPVWIRDDLSPEEVRALRLADNRVAESAMDSDMFRKELESLNYDLAGIFDEKELSFEAADLGELNSGAFVADIAAAVDRQTQEVKQIAEQGSTKPVAVHKILGFKEVPGDAQITLSRFMALIESQTGVTGEFALISHAERVLSEANLQ